MATGLVARLGGGRAFIESFILFIVLYVIFVVAVTALIVSGVRVVASQHFVGGLPSRRPGHILAVYAWQWVPWSFPVFFFYVFGRRVSGALPPSALAPAARIFAVSCFLVLMLKAADCAVRAEWRRRNPALDPYTDGDLQAFAVRGPFYRFTFSKRWPPPQQVQRSELRLRSYAALADRNGNDVDVWSEVGVLFGAGVFGGAFSSNGWLATGGLALGLVATYGKVQAAPTLQRRSTVYRRAADAFKEDLAVKSRPGSRTLTVQTRPDRLMLAWGLVRGKADGIFTWVPGDS